MAIAAIIAALVAVFLWQREAVDYLVFLWGARPEFSHGPILPLLAIWLAWRKRGVLSELPATGRFAGLAIVALGVGVVGLGDLSTLMPIVHYGIVIIAAMGIAFFLPPVGAGLTIAAGIAGEDIDEVARTYVPYLIALLVGLALVAALPDLTLVLPRWLLGFKG